MTGCVHSFLCEISSHGGPGHTCESSLRVMLGLEMRSVWLINRIMILRFEMYFASTPAIEMRSDDWSLSPRCRTAGNDGRKVCFRRLK